MLSVFSSSAKIKHIAATFANSTSASYSARRHVFDRFIFYFKAQLVPVEVYKLLVKDNLTYLYHGVDTPPRVLNSVRFYSNMTALLQSS